MGQSLTIKIMRLPDINKYSQLSSEFDNYGRFGITDKGFYVSPIASAHARGTKFGGYWATNSERDVLFLSPRGVALDFDKYVNDIVQSKYLDKILTVAGIRRYENVQIENTLRGDVFENYQPMRTKTVYVLESLSNDIDYHDNNPDTLKRITQRLYELFDINKNNFGNVINAGRFVIKNNGAIMFSSSLKGSHNDFGSFLRDSHGYFIETDERNLLLCPKNIIPFLQSYKKLLLKNYSAVLPLRPNNSKNSYAASFEMDKDNDFTSYVEKIIKV